MSNTDPIRDRPSSTSGVGRRPSNSTSRQPSAATSPASPAALYLASQPLPPIPASSSNTSGANQSRPSTGHQARQPSNSYKPSAAGDFESPRIPQLQQPGAESPVLFTDEALMADDIMEESVAGSAFTSASSAAAQRPAQQYSALSKKTSGSQLPSSGSAIDPRVVQHHPSQSNSLKTMNSQSSLAGMPTARSNRHAQMMGDSGNSKLSLSRSGSRQAANTGATVSAGGERGGPSSKSSTPNLPEQKENGASNGDTRETGGTSTPKPTKDGSAATKTAKEKTSSQPVQGGSQQRIKFRHTPHLPQYEADPAPSAMMHWSKAPVHGTLPSRSMRAHTVTMVDHVAWVFGGCDDRGCWRDVWCFDIETFQWSHPEMLGDLPPPCRAHTATLVDRKLYVFGGGEGPTYYNELYILDTVSHRWHKPNIPTPHPLPRRAHTAVLYRDTIYVFGGGNGHRALNDVWALDVSVPSDKLRWEQVPTHGPKPGARGYHTANLVGDVMIVLGGSDGRECFSDVWVLDLEKLVWREVRPDRTYRRLSHSSTQVGSYLFVMGGHDGNKYSHDLLLFNLVTLQFEPRQTSGRPPSSRGYHVMTLADSRLWVFGGFDGHMVYDDVWVLDLAAAAYLPQVTSFGIFVE